jgi:hypothetical protein
VVGFVDCKVFLFFLGRIGGVEMDAYVFFGRLLG